MDFEIDSYEDADGNREVEDFLTHLKESNKILWIKIYAGIQKLKYRFYHKYPLSKHVEGELFELRVDIARVIYCFDKGRMIILLCGFIKKKNKIPEKELVKARRLLSELRDKKGVLYEQDQA
jgi:phage-related protein